MLMGILPFGVFMGLGKALEAPNDDIRLFVTYILVVLILSYITALGAFALVQNHNCRKVNIKQVASNAGIAFGFQGVALLLTSLIPSLRDLVTNLLPPETDVVIKTSIGYSYWSFWAALFGIAVGGTLSGVCS
jgi:flagellar basal body-associated protein FliL